MSPTSSKLFASLLAEPERVDLKTLFARQLELEGITRGEFILLQLEDATKLDSTSYQAHEAKIDGLLRLHHSEWCEGLPLPMERCIYKSGFVEELDLSYIPSAIEFVKSLLSWPYVVFVKSLTLEGSALGDNGVEALCSLGPKLRLTSLNLAMNDISTKGVELLSTIPSLTTLTKLYLDENPLYDDGIIAISMSPIFCNVTYLGISCTGIDDRGVNAILNSPFLKEISTLDLRQTEISDEAAEKLELRFGDGLLY